MHVESTQVRPLRRLGRRQTTPPAQPGFAGPGHSAVEVLRPDRLSASDPFVLLMDDRLDFPSGKLVGGAHPHAGLETVTLVIEGSLEDRDEGLLGAGDALWMTAGRGIVHNEQVRATGRVRVLQLWIGLPDRTRYATPRFERIPLATLPIRREPGVEARIYSGSSGGLRSPTHNHVPVTLVDFRLARGATVEQQLPEGYEGFLYVLEGSLRVSGDGAPLGVGDVGWLAPAAAGSPSVFELAAAAADGARCVLYAGKPHGESLRQHGPFVAGSEGEILRFFHEYQAGHFVRLSQLEHFAPAASSAE